MENRKLFSATPNAVGLYDPANEHDACGVAMVATLNKLPTHEIVAKALTALRNLEHRGASGAEPDSGDGAGILIQVPDKFYRSVVSFKLPEVGKMRPEYFSLIQMKRETSGLLNELQMKRA